MKEKITPLPGLTKYVVLHLVSSDFETVVNVIEQKFGTLLDQYCLLGHILLLK